MEKKENLSEKINPIGKYNTIECLSIEDVKEAVRRLKEKSMDINIIKEIFGERLI